MTVTITGTSGNYSTSNNPAPPYVAPLSVYFANSTNGNITVWYKLPNAGFVQHVDVNQGQTSGAVNSTAGDLQFNIVPQGNGNLGEWTHIIHVGSGFPGPEQKKY